MPILDSSEMAKSRVTNVLSIVRGQRSVYAEDEHCQDEQRSPSYRIISVPLSYPIERIIEWA